MPWEVGKVKITKVVELETIGSTRFILPLASKEEIRKLSWLIPHFATEEGRLKMSIHSLVVETPKHRIVVDTGLGNDKQGVDDYLVAEGAKAFRELVRKARPVPAPLRIRITTRENEVNDQAVTVRERDSMKQERIGIDGLVAYLSERLADFVSDGIDIAIRCGGGQYPGLSAEC